MSEYTVSNSNSECPYFVVVLVGAPRVSDSECPYSLFSERGSECPYFVVVSLIVHTL